MLGSAYTLLVDGHVRLDIYYREFNARIRSIINIIGVICFLFPTCIVIWVYSLPYIQQSWRVLESSKETSGLPFVYLLKTVILLFTILLLTQGLSLLIHSILDLGSPPNKGI
jgi:TRAP-type mannitol/chloroaromatic compound transport system permease small subunit